MGKTLSRQLARVEGLWGNKVLDDLLPKGQHTCMGNPLRDFLNSSGETASAFAAKIGISSSYLSRLISGDREADASLIAAISRASANQVTPGSWVAWWMAQAMPARKSGQMRWRKACEKRAGEDAAND